MLLIINKIAQPIKKAVSPKIKKILILEKPNTFKFKKSLLSLILSMYNILDRKMIKGNKSKIMLGTKIPVNINGKNILTSKFLKNSISSNKFNITPKA